MKKNLFLWTALTVLVTACASIDPVAVTRPAGTKPYKGDRAKLVSYGTKLWKDPKIGKSGLACNSCHANGAQFKKSFKEPYPHLVKMANGMAGLKNADAEQLVQFCMMAPMKTDPLPWNSRELAALTAYVENVAQKEYIAKH